MSLFIFFKKLRKNYCYHLTFWRLLTILLSILLSCLIFYLCKIYLKFALLWLETQNSIEITIILIILFILVSLPISIGYIVLIIAEGYLFGIKNGIFLSIFSANIALIIAHNFLKYFIRWRIFYRFLDENDLAKAIVKVINGPLSFKIVLCSRLTPIPFGLQNTIFALSNVNTKIYHMASFLGLLPAQIIGVYAGTTLRSMQDVLEGQQMSSTAYFFIAVQLLMVVILMFWFSTKAKIELLKALEEAESSNGPKMAAGYSIV